MEAKGADLIAVNDVGQPGIGFDAEENEVVLLARDGSIERISRRSKRAVAEKIWDAFVALRVGRAKAPIG
jgi:phosphopantothenoylcysteine decarboxylase/phosphopantothenate--cysteine ligase